MLTYINPKTGKEIFALGEVAPDFMDDKIKRVKAIIYWSENISLLKQATLLKKICPLVNSISNSELLSIIRENTIKWKFGEFDFNRTNELIKNAKKYDLNIILEEL